MVSSDVVMETVKRMVSSGVDDETIRVTLKGINLPDEEISKVINQAKGISPQAETATVQEVETTPDLKEQDTGELQDHEELEDEPEELRSEDPPEPVGPTPSELRNRLESLSGEQAAQHATTHNLMEEHSQKVDEVKKSVVDLQKQINSTPTLSQSAVTQVGGLDKRISGLEKQIAETKANTIALQGLLKQILDTNKKTLLELQKKK
ncbi:hypothetical protein IIC68_00765 [archaeon]|nr:hypothetical protein [archaeon]